MHSAVQILEILRDEQEEQLLLQYSSTLHCNMTEYHLSHKWAHKVAQVLTSLYPNSPPCKNKNHAIYIAISLIFKQIICISFEHF